MLVNIMGIFYRREIQQSGASYRPESLVRATIGVFTVSILTASPHTYT